jgi:hypothetical protein
MLSEIMVGVSARFLNMVEERRQSKYQQWYQERNREALLGLRSVANMNETQIGSGLLKFLEIDGYAGENVSDETAIVLIVAPYEVCEHCERTRVTIT